MGGDAKIRIGDAAVFGVIQSFQFFFRGNPQANGLVDQLEHDEGGGEGPQEAGGDPQQLDADDAGRGAADSRHPRGWQRG